MRRKIVAALIAVGSIFALCGFENVENADQVLELSAEAMKEVKDVSAQADANLDLDIAVSQEGMNMNVGMKLGGTIDAAYTEDPLGLAMTVDFMMAAMGQQENMNMQMYAVEEDGTVKLYTYTSDTELWSYDTGSKEEFSEAMSQASELDPVALLKAAGIAFELAPEAVDVNGAECYMLNAKIGVEELANISNALQSQVEEAAEMIPDEEIQAMSEQYGDIKVNTTLCVDTTTNYITKFAIDLNGVDTTKIQSLIKESMFGGSEEGMEVSIDFKESSISVTFSYDDVTITVPEEAVNGVAAQSTGGSEDPEEPESEGVNPLIADRDYFTNDYGDYFVQSADAAVTALTGGTEDAPAAVGESVPAYFYDTKSSAYEQCAVTVTEVTTGAETDEMVKEVLDNGYLELDPETEQCILVKYDLYIPEDATVESGLYSPYVYAGEIEGIDGGSITADGSYYYCQSWELSTMDFGETVGAGETVPCATAYIIPADVKEFRIGMGPFDNRAYVNVTL